MGETEIIETGTTETAETPEIPAGGKEQEAAEPAAPAEGGNQQEVAEPAGETGASVPDAQSETDRRRYAAQRRESERERIVQQARMQERQDVDRLIAGMGKTNPYTGEKIGTLEQLQAYNDENKRRTRQNALKKAGVDATVIEGMIEDHPAIRAAQEAQQQYQDARDKTERMQAQMVFEGQLREIQKLDPEIRSFAELKAHPKYGEIQSLVRENAHTISEAFDIATREERQAQRENRVRQAAVQTAASKGHLHATGAAGAAGDEVQVPEETMRMYQRANPRITPEQARQKYRRYLSYKN